jgi:hypothetical protein
MIARSARRFLWRPVSKGSQSTSKKKSELIRALGTIKTQMRMSMIWMRMWSKK